MCVDKTKLAEYLYKTAINEVLDKVRTFYQLWAAQRARQDFPRQAQLLEQLAKVEDFASGTPNEMVQTIETFYQERKHLQRANYAKKIIAKNKMNKYLGKEANYKELAVKIYAHKAPVETIVELITYMPMEMTLMANK